MDNAIQNPNVSSLVQEVEEEPCVLQCCACGEELTEYSPEYERTHSEGAAQWFRQLHREHNRSCPHKWEEWRELVSDMLGKQFQGTPLVAAKTFLEAGLNPLEVPCPPDRVGDGWQRGCNALSWEEQIEKHVKLSFACLEPKPEAPEEPRTRPRRRNQRNN